MVLILIMKLNIKIEPENSIYIYFESYFFLIKYCKGICNLQLQILKSALNFILITSMHTAENRHFQVRRPKHFLWNILIFSHLRYNLNFQEVPSREFWVNPFSSTFSGLKQMSLVSRLG